MVAKIQRISLGTPARACSILASKMGDCTSAMGATPRATPPKAKAGFEENGAGSASAKEKGKKQKEWATEVLEEFTFPIPETVNISNKMLAAFRTLNPGVCWKLVMRGVCEADHCPVCSK